MMGTLQDEEYRGFRIHFRRFPDVVVAKIIGRDDIFNSRTKEEVFDKVKRLIDGIERIWDYRRGNRKYYSLEEFKRIIRE